MTLEQATQKLHRKYVCVFFMCTFVPLVLCSIVVYTSSRNNTFIERCKGFDSTIEQMAREFESIWLEILYRSENNYFCREISQTLTKNETEFYSYDNLKSIERIQDYLTRLIVSKASYVESVCYYNCSNVPFSVSSGHGIYIGEKLSAESWYSYFLTMQEKNQQFHVYWLDDINGSRLNAIVLSKKANNETVDAMIYTFTKDFSVLWNHHLSYTGVSFVIFDTDQIIHFGKAGIPYRNDVQNIVNKDGEYRDRNTYIRCIPSQFTDVTYVLYVDNITSITAEQAIKTTTLVVLLSCIISVLLTKWAVSHTYKPISNMYKMISALEAGKSIDNLALPPSEYDSISKVVLNKYNTIQHMKDAALRKDIQVKQAQLIALQAQMNPHFLFNTLDMIRWHSIEAIGEQNTTSQMLENLSKILRYTIRDIETPVTLEEELAISKLYVDIMDARHRGRVAVHWGIDAETLPLRITKLTIQPLLENCYLHAMKPGNQPLCIEVYTHVSEGMLIVSVTDNGLGIPPGKRQELQAKINGDDGSGIEISHIGLPNLIKRLNLNHSNIKADLQIESEIDAGTRITLTIKL